MSGRPDAAAPVDDALAKLREAMRVASGGTTDPDRRRAAAMLGELTRSDDADLARFAQRHLSGRHVDEGAVRDLRDLLLGVARLLAVQGRATSAHEVAGALRNQLYARLDELEEAAKGGAGTSLAPREELGPAPVPGPAPVVAAQPPRVMPSYLQATASPWSPTAAHAAADLRASAAVPQPAVAPAPSAAGLHMAPAFVAPAFAAPAPAAVVPFTPVPAAPAFVAPAQQPPMTIPPATVEMGAQIEDEGTVVGDSLGFGSSQVATGLPFLRTATPPRATAMVPQDEDRASSSPPPPNEAAPSSRGAPIGSEVPLPAHLAFIDLRSHAALTALVSVFPERLADICHQYGLLDPSERALLDDHWYARFRRLPHEREEWARYRDHAIAHYRGGR